MKQNTKIWLITICIFLALATVVTSGFFIIKGIINNRNDKAFEAHIAQAKSNVITHLSEKYPDKTFEIINTKCDALEDAIAVTRALQYSNDVWFEIKDAHGNIYVARSDTGLSGQAGIDATQDNVQTDEIHAAIKDYLLKAFNIDEDYLSKYCRFDAMYYLYHEKFDGDILAFAEKVSERNVYLELYYMHDKFDVNKIFTDNSQFFELFKDVLLVNSKIEITSDSLKHLVFNISNPKMVIPEIAPFVSHIYVLDDDYQLTKEESKIIKEDDVIYVSPYQDFDDSDVDFESTEIEDVDVGRWMESIGVLEEQVGETYSNVTPITGLHYAVAGIAQYIPLDNANLEKGQTLLLLTWIDSFTQSKYIAHELQEYEGIKIIGDYIYIAPMSQGIQWTVAKVDIGNVPVRVEPNFTENDE